MTAGLAVEGSALTLDASALRAGDAAPVALRADLRDGGAGVGAASVTAVLRADGQTERTVALRDAGGGRYVADETLPAGEWFGVVTATAGGRKRVVPVIVETGTDADGPGPAGDGDGTPSDGGGGGEPPAPPWTEPVRPIEPPQTVRRTPAKLVVAVKRRRDRRAPFAYRVRGRLVLPTGVAQASCRGAKVALVLGRGGRRVATREATLSAPCTFRARLASKRRRGRLTVAASFLGAPELLPIRAGALRVRAG